MRILTSLISVFLILIPVQSLGTTHRVDMLNFVFDPESLTVNQEDTVLWVGVEGNHTTTSGVNGVPDGHWDSGFVSPGDSFTFAFDSLGTFAYYCTFHWQMGMNGVVTVDPVGIEETGSDTPTQFSISQNYPNPFSASTLIEYELNMPAMTELVIFNTRGQRVNSLVEQYTTPGRYSVIWDGRDVNGKRLSNGVFFYAFKVGDDVIHKKMMIIR